MARTYRGLAALISYPTEALQAATTEIAMVFREEGLIGPAHLASLDRLLAELAERDIYDLQERYFGLFDRSRALYREHGLEPTAGELPDFLPLFLEFISLLPDDEAHALIAESAGILQALADRLLTRESAYSAVFQTLAAIAARPDAIIPSASQDDPDDLAALDAMWEEAAVHFGPGEQTDGCGTERLRTRLRAAARDAAIV
ncbi:MAG: nitrate reductase molybdenum cofactor assembly chaperone [Acidocella sp. 20-57-95]|nr:MAG: nitrate reductase molybdenum cofactor assembly chaperone [Acidocella sp. 20-57-95]